MAFPIQVFQVAGLVLRCTEVGDTDRMLTVLTAEEGKLSVFAKGAKKLNGGSLSACQPFAYALFTLRRGHDYCYLRESTTKETFHGLCDSLSGQALAAYFCEIAEELSYPGGDGSLLLRLTLNALWSIAGRKKPEFLLKGAFELRAAAIDGYMPDLRFCCSCGKGELPHGAVLDLMNGRIFCPDCFDALYGNQVVSSDAAEAAGTSFLPRRVQAGTLEAMRYILATPEKRQFAFAIPDTVRKNYAEVCEEYLLHHVGHAYRTLGYYKSVGSMMRLYTDITEKKQADGDGGPAQPADAVRDQK